MQNKVKKKRKEEEKETENYPQTPTALDAILA